jgi:hypothetical protein
MRFDNHYCRVTRFDGDTIIEMSAYLDSTMITELFRQNQGDTKPTRAAINWVGHKKRLMLGYFMMQYDVMR